MEILKVEEIKQLGGLEEGSSQRRIVYDDEKLSPTLQAAMGMGGGQIPMVVEKSNVTAVNPMEDGTCRPIKSQYHQTSAANMMYSSTYGATGVVESQIVAIDEQNKCIREDTFGTLTTDGSSPKHNNRVGEIKKIKIRQATKQGFIECEIGGVCCLEYPTSTLRRARTIENGQISPTITTESVPNRIELGNPDFYNFLYEIDGEIYLIRIRKLIPLECWRLMGFTDEDFYKAEKVNSNTQLYKQAGNSIVTNCLEAIFSQMNIEGVKTWNEKIKETEV